MQENAKQPKRKRCKICDVMLENPTELDDHMKTHMLGNDFKCNFCEYSSNKDYTCLKVSRICPFIHCLEENNSLFYDAETSSSSFWQMESRV